MLSRYQIAENNWQSLSDNYEKKKQQYEATAEPSKQEALRLALDEVGAIVLHV